MSDLRLFVDPATRLLYIGDLRSVAPTPPSALEVAILAAQVESLQGERDGLRSERDGLRSALTETEAELERLRNLLKQALRAQFGRRSEKLAADQLQLAPEDREQTAGTHEAAAEAAAPASPVGGAETERVREKRPPRRNRGALPAHLPRVEETIEPEDKPCPCCGGALHLITIETTEQLDVIPAQFRVKVTHRPKYAYRSCAEGVVQTPAPSRPITGGMATEGLVAYVVTGKICDHQPLYRQADIFARQGIDLDRSTLADWVGRAAWWLMPLYELLLTTILSSPKIFGDEHGMEGPHAPSRCSTLAAGGPRPGGSGRMPGTTGPGRDRCRRR